MIVWSLHQFWNSAAVMLKRFYVGKARSNHSVPQDGINAHLVEYAQKGKRVCA